jgi:hypothetical protein
VRCHHCHCSFAPGTRQCLHCGGKLGLSPEPPFGRASLDAPAGQAEDEIPVPSFARAVLWVLSAGVAIALSALQTCNR